MNTNLYGKNFYFGKSIEKDKYYVMQLVGYCGGAGVCDLEWWRERIDALVYDDIHEDIYAIEEWIAKQDNPKDRLKLTNKLKSVPKMSMTTYLEVIKSTPARPYLRKEHIE